MKSRSTYASFVRMPTGKYHRVPLLSPGNNPARLHLSSPCNRRRTSGTDHFVTNSRERRGRSSTGKTSGRSISIRLCRRVVHTHHHPNSIATRRACPLRSFISCGLYRAHFLPRRFRLRSDGRRPSWTSHLRTNPPWSSMSLMLAYLNSSIMNALSLSNSRPRTAAIIYFRRSTKLI